MENEKHYFTVGLFVFMVLAFAAVFVIWMLGHNGQGEQKPYAIYFNQAINGVSVGSQVRLRGIPVGVIKRIGFDEHDKNLIRVVVDIDGKAPIDGTTRATVQLQGVTGLAVIALNPKDGMMPDAANIPLAKDRYHLPVIPSEPSQLEQVFDKLPQLVDDVRDLAQRGQAMLSDDNIKALHDALQSIANVGQAAQQTMKSVGLLSNKGQNFFSDDNQNELREMLTEGKLTLREMRMLAKSLRDDPSQIIYKSNYGGYKPSADDVNAVEGDDHAGK